MLTNNKPLLVSVVGPTAVGKTQLAVKIAVEFNTEIISADSRQFYRELTIGTAKPKSEQLTASKHHFIDSHSIRETYSAGQFGRDATALLNSLFKKFSIVVAVGGSGLYLKSLWEGFDEIPQVPFHIRQELARDFKKGGLNKLLQELWLSDREYYEAVDKNNGQRIIRALEVIRGTSRPFSSFRKSISKDKPYRQLTIGISMDRKSLFERIDRRMDTMIDSGLFEEARSLYRYREHNALQTVGYSEIFDHMNGSYDKEETIRLLKRNSRRYARRQITWFRTHKDIHWFEHDQHREVIDLIKKNKA